MKKMDWFGLNGFRLWVGNIEAFIDEFKNKKVKELGDKNRNSAIS